MPVAYAHTNIALVKYWGKRGARALNLPAVGSLSLTLDRFGTRTEVALTGDSDRVVDAAGEPLGADFDKAVAFVARLRAHAGRSERFCITTHNDVPTAAGLASSASAFAALAMAAAAAFDVPLTPRALSVWARIGSGSAARSVFGGFVRMHRGVDDDGTDAYAEPIATSLDVRLVVVRCAVGKKTVPSTYGMDASMATSPMYQAWTASHAADLDDARDALDRGDLQKLGDVMEHNTLKMHATTLTARPGFWYLNPTTLSVMNAVRALRQAGTGAWFTMDAGPHVKVLCDATSAPKVASVLGGVPATFGVDVCAAGPAARLLS